MIRKEKEEKRIGKQEQEILLPTILILQKYNKYNGTQFQKLTRKIHMQK